MRTRTRINGWLRRPARVLAFTGLCWLGLLGPVASESIVMPYPACRGGEVGYWQPVNQHEDGVWLVLTAYNAPPFEAICYVPAAAKVMTMGVERGT